MEPLSHPPSERRQATVMFADISGFTAMSERMEPEEVTAVMNDCFEMMGGIINFYGGTIDKFIGDCVMAVFGVPVAIENAPRKAVNAAIELRKGVYRFAAERQLPTELDVHIGLNTGTVLAGEVGAAAARQYTVIGDAVNLASRLEDLSQPGQVLVGHATWLATRRDFDYREVGPVEFKGKSRAVAVYELRSEQEVLHRSRGQARRVHADMVGRKRELAQLRGLVTALCHGQGGVANVVGEAGIGKSRLLAELRLQVLPPEVRCLEGHAISIGRNLSFHPIVDLLRNLAGIVESDSDEQAVAKLAGVTEQVIGVEESQELLPFVIRLMGLSMPSSMQDRLRGIEGEALEKLVLRSLRELLRRGATKSPVVVILEDLHWADGSSLGLIEALLPLSESHPILFINVFRPGFPETSSRLLEAGERCGSRYLRVELQPLDEAQCGELLDKLLQVPGMPQAVREQILRRADGNPFFVEEVVRALFDEGAVVQEEGRFRVTDRIRQIEIPASVNDVLMARMDRLDTETRELLKTASVLGRRFFRRILKEVIDVPFDTDEHLRILTEAQFLQEHVHMQELEYLFKHALAQEVAYQSLLVQRRRELHARVAHSIERVFQSRLTDFYGMLAYHYTMAEEAAKAGEFMLLAGEEAARCSASIEALSYFQAALDLCERRALGGLDQPRLLQLQENTAQAYFARGRYTEAIAMFERVLRALGVRVGGPRLGVVLRFLGGMARLVQHLYLPATARRHEPAPDLQRILRLLRAYSISAGCVDASMLALMAAELPVRILDVGVERVEQGIEVLSSSCVNFSWSGVSLAMGRRLLDYVRQSGAPLEGRHRLYFLFGEVIHGFLAGEPFTPYEPAAVDQGMELGEVFHVSTLLVFWLYDAVERGDLETAATMIARMEQVASDYEDHFVRALVEQARGILLLKQRRLPWALAAMDTTIALNIENGQDMRNSSLLGLKAQALVLSGDVDAAILCLDRADALLAREERVIPYHLSNVLVGRAMVSLRQRRGEAGARGAAGKAVRAAVKNARKVATEQPVALRLAGLERWLDHDPKRACALWERALARADQLGSRLEAARTRHEVGLALSEHEGPHLVAGLGAAALLERGQADLQKLGVVPAVQGWW
ncbi:MAG: adenylate/guanylate cyclase domain-containing protein [Pseudomonadota bacterium]